jgi:hypothetical protein
MTTLIPKYDQGSTGAVNRPIDQKLGEWISVLDFGADPTGTSDSTTAIQNAINAAQAKNGGIVLIPWGTYNISSELVVSGSNVILQGYGGDGLHDGGTGAYPATKIVYTGASSSTSMIKFYTVQGTGNSKINGVGLKNIYLDCAGLKAGGVNILSVNNGVFDHITIMHPTYVGIQLTCYVAGALAEASDSQGNIFTNINVRCLDLSACINGSGFLLTTPTPGTNGANPSFNTFLYCGGQFVNGTAFLLQDCDNINFISCRAYIGGTGKGLWVQGPADYNYFYDFSCGGYPSKLYIQGTASGYYTNSQANCFQFPDQLNGTIYPNLDAGCRVYWQGSDGVANTARFNQAIFATTDVIANGFFNTIGNNTLVVDSNGVANIALTQGGSFTNSWGINVGSGVNGNDLRISTNGNGNLNLGNGANVAITGILITSTTTGSPPTSGTWAKGSICYNATPSAGGTPGWVCTTAGTPGTWDAMASLT